MKIAVLLSLSAMGWMGCTLQREVQVEIVNAQLVKIDTVYRHSDPMQMLIWKGSDNIDYVSYAKLEDVFVLGSRIPVMIRR